MSKAKPTRSDSERRVPKVRIARPAGRPFQLRYACPQEQREIRISTGTRDEAEAEQQKQELEAKLFLGIRPSKTVSIAGPQMPWDEFRHQYTQLQLSTIGDKSAMDAESRLDIAERILKPRVLLDIATAEALHRLQTHLLSGAESPLKRRRSPHTVSGWLPDRRQAVEQPGEAP
jgi:hypothetical protein